MIVARTIEREVKGEVPKMVSAFEVPRDAHGSERSGRAVRRQQISRRRGVAADQSCSVDFARASESPDFQPPDARGGGFVGSNVMSQTMSEQNEGVSN